MGAPASLPPAPLRAVLHVVPHPRPLLAPLKRTTAGEAGLRGTVRVVRHAWILRPTAMRRSHFLRSSSQEGRDWRSRPVRLPGQRTGHVLRGHVGAAAHTDHHVDVAQRIAHGAGREVEAGGDGAAVSPLAHQLRDLQLPWREGNPGPRHGGSLRSPPKCR